MTQAYCLSIPFRAPAIDRTSDLYGPWGFTVAVFIIVIKSIDSKPYCYSCAELIEVEMHVASSSVITGQLAFHTRNVCSCAQ